MTQRRRHVLAHQQTRPSRRRRDFGAETALAGPTLDLDRIWATLQPHYDGNALAEALDVPKGPLIGGLMAAQREWQLAQPAGDKDACLAYLRSRVEDLRQTHGQGRRGGKSKAVISSPVLRTFRIWQGGWYHLRPFRRKCVGLAGLVGGSQFS